MVESYTSHFVAALGFARFLHFLFWLSSYHELNDNYSGVRGIVGSVRPSARRVPAALLFRLQ